MRKIYILLTLFLFIFTTAAFAASFSMYEKPDSSSKVIATINNGDVIVPIFYPEKSEWVKIGNSKTGDVGWAKIKDLQGPVVVTKTDAGTIKQQIISDNKTPEDVKIIQYSGSIQMKQEDVDKFEKEMKVKQKKMLDSMEKMKLEMLQMMHDFSEGFTLPKIEVKTDTKKEVITQDKQ